MTDLQQKQQFDNLDPTLKESLHFALILAKIKKWTLYFTFSDDGLSYRLHHNGPSCEDPDVLLERFGLDPEKQPEVILIQDGEGSDWIKDYIPFGVSKESHIKNKKAQGFNVAEYH